MALPVDFLMELKYKNDIESVISSYVDLKRRGSNLVGLCPFHNEKTPSFTVYSDKGNYHCFGCGAGGDVITFIRQVENLDYMDAVRFLADRAGLTVPMNGVDDRAARIRKTVLEINRESAKFFFEKLLSPEGAAAKNYYLSRGLTPKTIKHFGLGFAPDSWDSLIKHLRSKGFSEADILAADMAVRGKRGGIYDKFRNRTMFPIIDPAGKVVGFSGRAMPGEDKSAKYINTGDTPVYKKSRVLYGMNFAKNHCSSQIILVEGNVDVVSLHQAGFENTVAACGTAFTAEQARLIARYTKEIVIVMDADTAGKKATDKVLGILESLNISAKVVRLPQGKDPDEFIKKCGSLAFEELIKRAVPSVEYKLYVAADGINLEADDGRLNYLKKAIESLAAIDDPLTVELYASRLTKYGVSKQTIDEEIKLARQRQKRRTSNKELREVLRPKMSHDDVNPDKHRRPRAVKAEEVFLSVLATHPDLYNKARDALQPDDLTTEFNTKFYSRLCEIYETGYNFDLSLLGEEFTAKQIGYVSSMISVNGVTENPEKVMLDSVKVILEEKNKLEASGADSMDDSEWAAKMNELAKKHLTKNSK